MGYQFEVIYKPGPDNKDANALSCQHLAPELHAISISPYWVYFPRIRAEVQQDPNSAQLSSALQSNPNTNRNYTLRDGFLFFKGHLMLPKTLALISTLLA